MYENSRDINNRIDVLKDLYIYCRNVDERMFIEEEMYEAKQMALRAWMDEEVEMECE